MLPCSGGNWIYFCFTGARTSGISCFDIASSAYVSILLKIALNLLLLYVLGGFISSLNLFLLMVKFSTTKKYCNKYKTLGDTVISTTVCVFIAIKRELANTIISYS